MYIRFIVSLSVSQQEHSSVGFMPLQNSIHFHNYDVIKLHNTWAIINTELHLIHQFSLQYSLTVQHTCSKKQFISFHFATTQ